MAKNIFIAATGQNCGKTTTSIGLMHLAQKKYRRVGFIKPLGPKPVKFHRCTVDKDAALIAQVFDLEKELRYVAGCGPSRHNAPGRRRGDFAG